MSTEPLTPPGRATDQPEGAFGGVAAHRAGTARRRVLAGATALAMAAVAVGAATGASAQGAKSPQTPAGSVVVFGCTDPASAVSAAGGHVDADLPLIHGVAAHLPAGAGLTSCTVAADRAMHVTGLSGAKAKDTVTGPASTARQTLGLTSSSPDGGGVTVAVVDTGVDAQPDLAGRVVHVDVTGTSKNSDPDDYGHGTFVAGLVAGNGHDSGGAYAGAAPQARLLDVRVASDDGSTSLIQVLRGLQVVALAQKAMNVRVLNLSLSSGSPIPYQFDPLSQALEALWAHGVVVVVPAGNDGPGAGTIASPGNDPVLLTVGALDEGGDGTRANDTVAPFSSRGPAPQGIAKPDVVAPGAHLISLRAPGSLVDATNPDSRIGTGYFRGSGTSMSTALTSGVAADLLSARPTLSPDQVKGILTNSAYKTAALTDPLAAGHGGVNAAAAFTARPTTVSDSTGDWPAGQEQIWNSFSIALVRGDRAAAFFWWQKLTPAARSWVARSWTALSPAARSWVARSWVARSWVGADGTADEWLARSWAARSWVARSWTGLLWDARSWTARSWTARSWTDDDWAARSWTARSWTARSWSTDHWS